MGLIADARTDLRTILTQRLPALTRAQRRRYVAALVDAGQEWLSKRDAQDAATRSDFAASRPAQYATFVATLPEVTLGADPVEEP